MSRRKSTQQILEQRFGDATDCVDLENPFLAQIAARGSCRKFQKREVDQQLVHTLCAVALSSPSKSDLQQRDLIWVRDVGQRKKIASLFEPAEWFEKAPVLMVICGNNRRQRQIAEMRNKPFPNDHLDAFFNASVDAGIALSTLVVASEAVGLGCCPISILRNHAEKISDILNLPENVFPVAGLGLGWPLDPPEISPRMSLSTTVHIDSFTDDNIATEIDAYDARRNRQQPYDRQRLKEKFGESAHYGWSEDKARQYSEVQREHFGQFIREKKFNLD